jgi:predicted ATP-grasp superfamily ATP-dependent carboligase
MIAVVVSGYTMGLGVVRSLGRRGVPIILGQYDDGDIAQYSRHVSETVRLPHPNQDQEAFIEALMKLGARLGEAVLFPVSDASLAPVSRFKSTLEEHFRVASVDGETSKLFLEKEHTYRLAAAAGVPVPETLVPRDLDEVREFGSRTQFPLVVKPSQSHLFVARFGIKMLEVNDLDSLEAAYRRTTEAGLEVLLQEIIPGPASEGVNYNSYFVGGRPVAEFTARQLRNAPSQFGSPRVARSERIPEVIESGRRTVEALGYEGFSCVEFMRDERDGQFKLMELNGRHNLSGLLSVATGVDFPWIDYTHLVSGSLPERPEQVDGVYWIDMVRDVEASLQSYRVENLGLGEFLRPYRGPRVFAIWDTRDPLPFLQRVRKAVVTAIRGKRP